MNLSMYMLRDTVENYVIESRLGDEANARCLSGVLPYIPSQPLLDNHAYIISADDAEKLSGNKDSFFIIYGADSGFRPNCPHIIMRPELSFNLVLSLMLSAIEKYNRWYDALMQELIEIPNLIHICDIGYRLLENPITLYDPNHVLIANSGLSPDFFTSILEKREKTTYALSDAAYKAIVTRPEFEDDIETGRASFMPNPLGTGNLIYFNIQVNNFEYRLCINDINRHFRQSDFQLCQILAEALQMALKSEHLRESDKKGELRRLINDIVTDRSIEDAASERTLRAYNWQRNDSFVCLSVEKKNPSQQFVPNDLYICTKIEELLSDACAFMESGKIVCISHISPALAAADIPARLESFLRDNIFIVGISNEFNDIFLTRDYYSEADIAIQNGRLEQQDSLFHRFSDYSFQHLLRHGFSGLSPLCYCDKNVFRLRDMSDSRVDYCETLLRYIENDRNLLKTSEALHIHRTTLFYRLNKIREAVDFDIDDPKTRLRIWLSFIIMGM